jgi:hypothetical protein
MKELSPERRKKVDARAEKLIAKESSRGRLFLTFWHICLENLPAGNFSMRNLSKKAAQKLIATAQKSDRLLCVTMDDILAPWHEHELKRHKELCQELSLYNIQIKLGDFSGENCINPLNCIRIEGKNKLLIVSCHYRIKNNDKNYTLTIAPDTISFSLIEKNLSKNKVRRAQK